MKLKNMLGIFALVLTLTLAGCSSSSGQSIKSNGSNTSVNTATLSKEEFEQVYTDADKFKGRTAEFYAEIFVQPEKDEKGTYLQVYADPKNSSKNTLIGINNPSLDVKQGDIIKVKGEVKGKQTGKNAFGAEMSLPVIIATSVDKASYSEAFSPAIKTVEVNKELDQNGYVMNLKKVEFAQDETRAYVEIKNNSNDMIHFYNFNSKMTQGDKQLEEQDNYKAKYPEINNEILKGIKSEGIVTFMPVNIQGDTVKFIFEGRSDNYSLKFEPFVFEVPVK